MRKRTKRTKGRERKVPETPKLAVRLTTPRAIMRTSFKVRPTNTETESVSYLPNRKVYELQTWYTDGARLWLV